MKSYPDYTVFNGVDKRPIGALVKITLYNFQYMNRNLVSKKYGEYKQAANAIRNEYGIDDMKSRTSYKQKTSWSPNAPETYVGNNEELKDHSYSPQNVYGSNTYSTVYTVGLDGKILNEIPQEQIAQYLKEKDEVSGVSALRKMGAEDAKIKEYIKKMKDLKFKYVNFESKSILWIAATVNGEKIIYINDDLQRAVDGIDIRPEDFREIARNRYKITLDMLGEMENREMRRKNVIRLTESDLHRIIRESVRKILDKRYFL